MNIIHHKEFYNIVGGYNAKLVVDIINAYNISFFTLSLNEERESIKEMCSEECIERDWDLNNVTVLVSEQKSPSPYFFRSYPSFDNEIKCGILNINLSKLIKLFIKTKKLKAFL